MGVSIWNRALNTAQVKNDYTIQPSGLKWRSNTIFILATIAVGLFTDLFLYGLIVPVLPFMLEDRGGVAPDQTQSYVSSMLAVYAGSSFIASPIAGVLADRVSTRQAPFLLALSIMLGATVLLFLGHTVEVFLIARVLQGISSGFVWCVGLALCVETVGSDNLGKTIGTLFSFISAGSIWAPFLGGLLYEKLGYNGIMGASFAVIGLDLIMRVLMIEKKVARRYGLDDTKVDENEDPESTSNSESQQTDSTEDGERQPLLGRIEEDDEEAFKLSADQPWIAKVAPIIPCLASPALLTALFLAAVQAVFIGSFDATVTTVSRELFGFHSFKAGLFFLAEGSMDLIFGPLIGWSIDRYGTKPAAVISYAFIVPVFILLRIPHAGGLDQILLYGFFLCLAGIAMGGQSAPSVVESEEVVRKYHEKNLGFFGDSAPYAQLYALNSMAFNLGLTVGPELAGELKSAIGYGNMNIVLAVIGAIASVLSWMYIGGKPKLLRRLKK